MKKLALLFVMLLLTGPTAAGGGPSSNANMQATVKTCNNLKAQMGARNFKATFAPRTRSGRVALRNCARREAAAQTQARTNAAHTCKTWRENDDAFQAAMLGTPNEGKTFAEVFGPKANAYGKCVSTVARKENRERRGALVNAAKTCRAWKSDADVFAEAMEGTPNEGKTFAQVYGSGMNAFGKCVSQQARAAS
jgi:hypothetical protein